MRRLFIRLAAACLLIGTIAAAEVAKAGLPLFVVEEMTGLCGLLDDHLRVAEANGFERTLSLAGTGAAGAIVLVNDELYWMLLLVLPGAPDRACLVSDGIGLEWPGGRRE
ncbi:MAG: hypothetical protein K2X46_11110 [Roseomonas sp.]|nr:hypothetical protein [Roseomonas sp.]